MNLINDLDTEIAFAFLVEKKHKDSVSSKYVKYLIDTLNHASEQVAEPSENRKDEATGEKLSQSVSN